MILLRLCRNTVPRLLVALVIISSLIVPPVYSQETEDSQVFIAGFNAYQQKDYASSIEKLSDVLQKYPDSPLRDMVLFWLSRSYYKTGNQQEAARYLSQFSKEYPDNPLKSTVEEELLTLASRYEKGEKLPVGAPLVKTASKKAKSEKDSAALAKAEEAKRLAEQKEKERLAAAKAEQEKLAAAKAEQEKLASAKAEQEKLAAAKAAEAKRAAEQQEVERQAAAKAEQEKAAAIQAEQARVAAAAAAAESARVADLKLAEEKAAAEKLEQEKLASAKAEQEKLAVAKAEQEKLAAAKAEEAKLAAEQQEAERQTAAKAEQEKAAAIQAEQARVAAAAAAAESARVADLKLAEEKAAAEKLEQERLAAAKAEQEKLAAAKDEEIERLAELREMERLASASAERATTNAEQAGVVAAAESGRVAALKLAEEKAAAEKLEQEKIAAAKVEQEKIAAAKAVEAKRASDQQESARQAATKAEQVKTDLPDAARQPSVEQEELVRQAIAKSQQKRGVQDIPAKQPLDQQKPEVLKAENAEQIRKAEEAKRLADAALVDSIKQAEIKGAAEKQELDRLAAAATAEQERIVLEKAAQDKAAQQKSIRDADRQSTAVKEEQKMLAELKAGEAQRISAAAAAEEARLTAQKASAERAVKEEETRRQAAVKAEQARIDELKRTEEQSAAAKKSYREKAISQYKNIIDKFPTSPAAVTAAVKLRELGVVVALPKTAEAEKRAPENAQVFKFEVAQFAGFEFNLQSPPDAFVVGLPASIPFEVINRGNGKDSFSLESSFPARFKTRFSPAAAPESTISKTPELAPGETFKGSLEFVIPPSSIDGLRILHPVKAASLLMAEASQSREVRLVASAPLLRAVVRTDKAKPLPGEQLSYSAAVLNVGSTVAKNVTFRLNFPPQLEPVDYAAAGFKREMPSALILEGLQVNSGESRQFSIAFKLKEDSLAGQELSTRAELINNPLGTNAAFVSNVSYVEPQRSITVRNGSERVVAIPGQTISVPFVVTNSGNIREKFRVSSTVSGAKDVVVFSDLNRDGIRQASEPIVSEIGPLAPREEASVVVEIKTPATAVDLSQGSLMITFVSEGDSALSATGTTQLAFSRPVLTLLMSGRDGRLKPGDVASFDLNIANNGSNLGKVVELQSTWPEQLELVAAEPSATAINNGLLTWRFKEVGAGEKRAITVSFRVKAGTGVGTAIQVKNVLMYEDQLGNRY